MQISVALLAGASPVLRAFAAALCREGHAVAEHALVAGGAADWLRASGSGTPLIDAACLTDDDPPAAAVFVADAAQVDALPEPWLHGAPTIIAASDDTARHLATRGAAGARLRTVPPGTDPAPRSTGPLHPQCCVVSAAPPGDAALLLRALHRLPDLDWTLALATELPPRTTEPAPRLRHAATIESLWADAGVFALAAEDDRGAALVAQALRRGVPVAVTASGSVKALVPANAGVIAAPGDVVALSNGLRRMICDAPLRAAMAETAWAHGRTLPDWPAQATMLVAALQA